MIALSVYNLDQQGRKGNNDNSINNNNNNIDNKGTQIQTHWFKVIGYWRVQNKG